MIRLLDFSMPSIGTDLLLGHRLAMGA